MSTTITPPVVAPSPRGPASSASPLPPPLPMRQFTVAEYHRLIQSEILTDEDKVELLNGYLVLKTPRNPPHDSCLMAANEVLPSHLPTGWSIRCQSAVTLAFSEPEPDLAIVRGTFRDYQSRHPGAPDVGLLIEVADSSLSYDRDEKGPIYAEAGIPEYWIVNLIDRQIEVYTSPTGTGADAAYTLRRLYRAGDSIPLNLDGATVGQIAVRDVLP